MQKSEKIIEKLSEIIKSGDFKNSVKERQEDFIRSRKVDFENLMYMLLNLMKRSLQIELDEFVEQHMERSVDSNTETV